MDSRWLVCVFLISCALGAVHGFRPRIKLGDQHVVGGEEVPIEEVPYQLSIRRFLNHHCGASLIGKYYALTAAHCFHNRNWIIWYGVAGGSNHIKQGSYKFVRSITSHEKFVYEISDYDVAVVRVWFGFPFNERSIRIDPVNIGERVKPGTNLVVSGWGKISQFADGPTERLRKTEVQVIEQSKCKEIYNDLTDRMFCAGTEEGGKDSCNGDSGGPIVDFEIGKQAGVISWGIGCGNPSRPGVYTDLSHSEIRQFIDKSTKY